MITYEQLRQNADINTYITRADESLSALGFTEHSFPHVCRVAEIAGETLRILGYHDEGTGVPVNAVAAALILADKSDVRRNRVRNRDIATFDIHDRVNYSVEHSALRILPQEKVARLELTVDTQFSSVMDFFEIFMKRMLLCRRAAERLGLTFQLTINGQQLI